MSRKSETKEVVIVGGGFAGINAALHLSNANGIHVTLIDKRNHHLFQPLLYQVAMAALSPAEIAAPIRSVVRHSTNIDVRLGVVTRVNMQEKTVHLDFGDIRYDYLILACGSNHSYFGHDEWEEHAPGLKSLEEALEIRRRVLTAFELAEREQSHDAREELLTFVIVGAGPTGVELAGALAEISHYTMGHDFRIIDPRKTRVVLIEGGPRVLPTFEPSLSEYALKALGKLDVEVRLNSIVSKVSDRGVVIGNEEIRARTVLWAAGVQPAEINKELGVPLDRAGRVIVDTDCTVPGHPEVFVLGDQAAFPVGEGKFLPGVATVAIQQGRYLAKLIRGELKGKKRQKFEFWDKGSMATIGRALAVLQTKRLRMNGFFAWLGWLLVHIYYLIGFENRLMVMFQWAYNYLTMGRGARIITNRTWQSHKK